MAEHEPFLIQFAIIDESQRSRYPDGWIPVMTSPEGGRRYCRQLLRRQGYATVTLSGREWRVVVNPEWARAIRKRAPVKYCE